MLWNGKCKYIQQCAKTESVNGYFDVFKHIVWTQLSFFTHNNFSYRITRICVLIKMMSLIWMLFTWCRNLNPSAYMLPSFLLSILFTSSYCFPSLHGSMKYSAIFYSRDFHHFLFFWNNFSLSGFDSPCNRIIIYYLFWLQQHVPKFLFMNQVSWCLSSFQSHLKFVLLLAFIRIIFLESTYLTCSAITS